MNQIHRLKTRLAIATGGCLPNRPVSGGDAGCRLSKEDVMNRWFRLIPLLLLAVIFFTSPPVRAQMSRQDAKQPHARISLYRVAPGKHVEFLKWMADNDAVDKEAGVPASTLYAHLDGDSWDFLGVAPDLTRDQQAKVDEVAKKRGRKTGFPASLEFRTFVAWHTDTFAMGPVSAADLVAASK
jgi:hypothetical protein